MFINPKIAIQEGWITGLTNQEVQVQPNAIDFTLDNLYSIYQHNEFIICHDPAYKHKEVKQMRGGLELTTVTDRSTGVEFYHLNAASFDGASNVYVDLPEGVAAQLIIRSTFNRNGLFLTSGLYDSGFKGHIGFVLHNRVGPAKIERGIRIGQIIFVEAGNATMYNGSWNHQQGEQLAYRTSAQAAH